MLVLFSFDLISFLAFSLFAKETMKVIKGQNVMIIFGKLND